MKKILSIFAAALVAIAVNATILDIAPDSPQSSDNIRREIRDHINAGDTLRLADGIYTESDVVELNKSVVIMAAEGASPIVKQQYYMKLLGENTEVTIIGVKFDASLYPASDHCIRAYDGSAGKKLTLENCEFVNWPSYILYSQKAERCLNELVIKNCYFHDNQRCAVYLGAEDGKSCNKVNIYGSTFANFSALQNPVIYVNNGGVEQADIEVRIDHCTFYNYMKASENSYTAIDSRKSTDVVISNCIFAQPSEQQYGSTYCYGGTINNCLSFNTTGHRSSGVQLVDNIEGDPLFVNAAEGNLTLGEGSPALTAAADGGAIGDPRWVPADPVSIDDGYYLAGTFNGVDKWSVNELSADVKFVENNTPEARSGEMVLRSVTLTVGDEFKVAHVENGIIPSDDAHWYGSGDGNVNFKVTEAYAGQKDIYFVPSWQNDWNGYIWVTDAVASAIENNNATAKAVKMMENGQLVIIKNGVKYNVLGTAL